LAAASKVANDQMNATPSPQQSQTPPSTAGQSAFGNMATGLLAQQPTQQANLKARLKSGQGMGTKTGSGYKKSRVGVPVQKLSGADASGAPKFTTVRENFLSNYHNFDALLESILSEAATGMAPAQWVKQYIAALMRVEEKDIPHSETLDNIANTFQTQIYNQNISPSDQKSIKSMVFPEKVADQLYAYFASSASLKPRPQQTSQADRSENINKLTEALKGAIKTLDAQPNKANALTVIHEAAAILHQIDESIFNQQFTGSRIYKDIMSNIEAAKAQQSQGQPPQKPTQ
jgi:hypothetical protein